MLAVGPGRRVCARAPACITFGRAVRRSLRKSHCWTGAKPLILPPLDHSASREPQCGDPLVVGWATARPLTRLEETYGYCRTACPEPRRGIQSRREKSHFRVLARHSL